jgi:hypothetical protein
MGYRELLKKYIRFLEMYAGDNFIEAITYSTDHELGERDLAELRTLAGEIHRDVRNAGELSRCPNFNHRLRLLCICYGLTPEQTAQFAGIDLARLRRWRTNPRSPRHLALGEHEFLRFEGALLEWLEKRRCNIQREKR